MREAKRRSDQHISDASGETHQAMSPLSSNVKSWPPEDIALLAREYPDTQTVKIAAALGRTLGQVYRKARALGLKKSEQYLASPAACRLRRGDNIGAAYRFKKGGLTWNKGLQGWTAGGRSVETRRRETGTLRLFE